MPKTKVKYTRKFNYLTKQNIRKKKKTPASFWPKNNHDMMEQEGALAAYMFICLFSFLYLRLTSPLNVYLAEITVRSSHAAL